MGPELRRSRGNLELAKGLASPSPPPVKLSSSPDSSPCHSHSLSPCLLCRVWYLLELCQGSDRSFIRRLSQSIPGSPSFLRRRGGQTGLARPIHRPPSSLFYLLFAFSVPCAVPSLLVPRPVFLQTPPCSLCWAPQRRRFSPKTSPPNATRILLRAPLRPDEKLSRSRKSLRTKNKAENKRQTRACRAEEAWRR